jgi:hemerythrin
MKRLSEKRVQRAKKIPLSKVLPSKLMPLWTEVTQYTNTHYKEEDKTWSQIQLIASQAH